MSLLEEQLRVLAGQWAEGPFSFGGRHYTARELDALPKPVQRPRPHLIVGGRGGPRSLALAARFADEYDTVSKTAAECGEIRRGLDSACRREGRAPIPLSLITGWLAGEDRAEAARASRPAGRVARPPRPLDEVTAGLRELGRSGVERVMLQQLLHRDLDAVEQRRAASSIGTLFESRRSRSDGDRPACTLRA
jgi:alkanesulfonate monooxygenase SsuD/methylene tetrahydromethanopterin reductase-like flavin-dependent oxidoreductase (luciferase family)